MLDGAKVILVGFYWEILQAGNVLSKASAFILMLIFTGRLLTHHVYMTSCINIYICVCVNIPLYIMKVFLKIKDIFDEDP